jgi:hypothetical protein
LSGLKPKDLVGIPWRVAFAQQDDGWWLRRDNVWSKPNSMPESCKDRPLTQARPYGDTAAFSVHVLHSLALRRPRWGFPS